ncbi:predicted protein [Streptomyces iranensis]|uniref:Uncharacterized protein n=1 Tax=Streptomyces iranensis TaxID=576784 RepID=A0A061A7J1_9ACTN|nr:predicted protein [Streptomyces iranensis]
MLRNQELRAADTADAAWAALMRISEIGQGRSSLHFVAS